MTTVAVYPPLGTTVTMDDGVTVIGAGGAVLTYTAEVVHKLSAGVLLTYDPRPDGSDYPDTPPQEIDSGDPLTVVELFTRRGNYDGQVIAVRNYDTGKPYGGGLFEWDAASTATHNAGTCVGTFGVGRWKRIYSGPMCIEWFGADMTGATSANAVLATADTAAVAAGKGLEISGGTLRISANLTLASPVAVHRGGKFSTDSGAVLTINGAFSAGRYSVFVGTVDATYGPTFGAGSVDAIFPEWFGAVANSPSSIVTESSAAILKTLQAAARGTVGFTYRVSFGQGVYTMATAIDVPAGGNVIWEGQGISSQIRGANSGAGYPAYLFKFVSSAVYTRIRGLYFYGGSSSAPVAYGIYSAELNHTIIEGCWFSQFSVAAIASSEWDNTFRDNEISDCYTAIWLRRASNNNDILIDGNKFTNCQLTIVVNNGTSVRIVNNQFQGMNATPYTKAFIYVRGISGLTIQNNYFETQSGGGLAGVPFTVPEALSIYASVIFNDDPYFSDDSAASKTVIGATNASPIVITTSAAHGYSTGGRVWLAGVAGNTAANGLWTVTSLSATTFSLDGSTGNGAYTSGGTAYIIPTITSTLAASSASASIGSIRDNLFSTASFYLAGAGGSGYTAGAANFTAKTGTGSGASGTIAVSSGAASSCTVSVGGTGYQIGDLVTIDQGGNVTGFATVATTTADNAIATLNIGGAAAIYPGHVRSLTVSNNTIATNVATLALYNNTTYCDPRRVVLNGNEAIASRGLGIMMLPSFTDTTAVRLKDIVEDNSEFVTSRTIDNGPRNLFGTTLAYTATVSTLAKQSSVKRGYTLHRLILNVGQQTSDAITGTVTIATSGANNPHLCGRRVYFSVGKSEAVSDLKLRLKLEMTNGANTVTRQNYSSSTSFTKTPGEGREEVSIVVPTTGGTLTWSIEVISANAAPDSTSYYSEIWGPVLAPVGLPVDTIAIPMESSVYTGSVAYNPASIADGAGETVTVTCNGARLGDFATVAYSGDTQGIMMTAWVSATNVVSVRVQNETGGAIDLNGTLRVSAGGRAPQ